MNYILLIFGFLLLIKGAIYFVDGSSDIATILKIPPILIGLTIVAFGTSLPEVSVSIIASIDNQNGLSLGNIIGSNIFNILMVLGTTAFIKNLQVRKSIVKKEMPILIITSMIALYLSIDLTISRIDGMILLLLFLLFLYDMIKEALRNRNLSLKESYEFLEANTNIASISIDNSLAKSLLISGVGLIAIIIGGKMVVSCATNIAYSFGVSDHLIGISVVALGTSLPEFITSVIAATKGENDIAVGNVISSNIFNILFILGASAFISPLSLEPALILDSIFMICAIILSYIFVVQDKEITKYESLFLITTYFIYMIYLVSR